MQSLRNWDVENAKRQAVYILHDPSSETPSKSSRDSDPKPLHRSTDRGEAYTAGRMRITTGWDPNRIVLSVMVLARNNKASGYIPQRYRGRKAEP